MSDFNLPVTQTLDCMPEPILYLEDGLVQYRNPAAARLAWLPSVGSPLPELLETEADAALSLTAGGRRWTAVSWACGAGWLLRLSPGEEQSVLPNDRIPFLLQKLRGPLAGMMSSEELVRMALTPDQKREQGDVLARYSKSQLRVLRMLRLLELAALPDGELPFDFTPQVMDLVGLCRWCLHELEGLVRMAGCEIVLKAPRRTVYARCDDQMFLYLVCQLVSNALRATGAGGQIVLRLEVRRQRAYLSVEDNGPGLTREKLSLLFDPTRGGDALRDVGEGLSLGIPVCQKIAGYHDGSLVVSNLPERGVRVTFSLPLYHPGPTVACESPRQIDTTNGFGIALRELSDVLPEECFHPEEME
ncbi:MAG: sensor histidine kinase [Clostridiales bacterium]|nr:sensor histidine kinase [Clostridiales bacterium]